MSPTKGVRLMSALKFFTDNYISWDKFSVFSKINILSMEDGKISAEFRVTEDISNMSDTLHGGFTSALIDSLCAFGFMCHSRGALAITTNLSVSILKPARLGDMVAVNIAPLSVSKNQAVMEACLVNLETTYLIAKGTTSLHIPERPLRFYDKFPFDPTLETNIEQINKN